MAESEEGQVTITAAALGGDGEKGVRLFAKRTSDTRKDRNDARNKLLPTESLLFLEKFNAGKDA